MVVPVQNPAVIGYFEPAAKCYSDIVKVDTLHASDNAVCPTQKMCYVVVSIDVG